MDIGPTSATAIARGVPEQGRRYLGTYYRSAGRGIHYVHEAGDCLYVRKWKGRVAVFDLGDGVARYEGPSGELRKVTICPRCSTTLSDPSWRSQGACFDSRDDGFFSSNPTEIDRVIDKYCNVCPVVRECLEYGASDLQRNTDAVWGGVYFYRRSRESIEEIIDRRRQELDVG